MTGRQDLEKMAFSISYSAFENIKSVRWQFHPKYFGFIFVQWEEVAIFTSISGY